MSFLTGHIKILYTSNLSCSTLLPLLQWREAIRNSKARRELGSYNVRIVRVRDLLQQRNGMHYCGASAAKHVVQAPGFKLKDFVLHNYSKHYSQAN